jgi:hypothetical protein
MVFGKQVTQYNVCVLILCIPFVRNISHSKKKSTQISDLMKIHPVGAEFHADSRTDMTNLTVALRNFENASKTS